MFVHRGHSSLVGARKHCWYPISRCLLEVMGSIRYSTKPVYAGFAALLCVLVGLSIFLYRDHHYLSPDETANAAFARQFALTGHISMTSSDTYRDSPAIPRSMTLSNGVVVPASFVAFPALLGAAGWILGTGALPLVPLLGFVVSVIAVQRVAHWYFDVRMSRLAFLFYVVNPDVLFYSTRTLWHNATFMYMLLIGWAALIEGAKKKSWLWISLGSLLYAVGLAIRPSEVIWALALVVSILISLRPLPRRAWLALVFAPAIVLVGMLWLQADTYGSALSVGYAQQSASATTVGAVTSSFFERARLLFFPFGIDVIQSLGLFFTFTVRFVAVPTILGLIGLVVALRQRHASRPVAMGACAALVWLILFYGSYTFAETFTRSQIGLGSSYLRYWLPGLALLVLFAPVGLQWLRTRQVLGPLGARLLIAAAIILGLQSWLVDPEFGAVKAARRDLADLSAARTELLAVVPPDGVVAAGTLDKAFFPERRVIGYSALTQTQADQFVLLLQRGVPLYFTSSIADDIRLVERTFKKAGYELSYLRTLTGGARLYATVRTEEEEDT